MLFIFICISQFQLRPGPHTGLTPEKYFFALDGPEAEKSKSRKSRKSRGEAVEYLKERAPKEIQLREQELEMRKKEQDSMSQREREKNEQQDKMLSTMLKQQEQQQQTMMMLLNQQQQQSQALLSLFQGKTQLFLLFSLWIHSRSVLS